jgi:type I restriction enzyme, S subunit
MSFEWQTVSLGQCAELDLGYPFKSADYTDSENGTRLLRGDNIGQGQLRWDGVRKWLRRDGDKLANYELRENDLVLAMDRPWISAGLKFARVRTSDLPSLLVQRVARLRPREDVDADYLHSVIASADFTQHIQTITTGTAVPHISGKQIQEYKFDLPDMATQRAIGSLLIGFDDRITLLRETNATLEAIAQALFKSWFVDFDPVRAKQEGRAPEGMDEATAALFPDGFQESELGLVPRGWRVATLQDLLVLQRGFDLPAQDRVPGDYPIIAASGPSGTHTVAMAKGPGVVTGRSGVLGRVFLELEDYWPLNTALWVKEFRGATPCYAYEVLRLLDFSSFNAGSAVPTLNRNHVHGLRYLFPSKTCVESYESLAIQLHQRVRLNQKQAQTLATLRDTLLPRLISGQLRLPELAAAETHNP